MGNWIRTIGAALNIQLMQSISTIKANSPHSAQTSTTVDANDMPQSDMTRPETREETGQPTELSFLSKDRVAVAADWMSILGIFLTLYTALKVMCLSQQYLFAGRVRDYKKQISSHCKDLNTQLASGQFTHAPAAATLVICLTVIKRIAKTGPDDTRKNAKLIRQKIKIGLKQPARNITRDFVVEIQRELRGLEEDLAHNIKDQKITPQR